MSKDVFLDTKGTCFLCLQEPVSDNENVVSEISLQTICRCLNINPISFPWKELPPKKNGDFSVIMCSTCSATTRKLTDLINQIELIKNLLTYQLQVFHRTIKTTSEPEGNPDSSQILKGSPAMKEQVDLVERLRTAIKEKCSKRIEQIEASNVPKVLLDRLSPQTGSVEDVVQIPPNFNKRLVQDLCKKNSSKRGNKYLCSSCDYSTTEFFRIQTHLVNGHPQIFFISQKPSHMSDGTFRDYCRRLYSKEIFRAKQRGGKVNGKQSLPCENCNRKCSCKSTFKRHLLLEHYKILKRKLNDLLKAPPSKHRQIFHRNGAYLNPEETKISWICGPGMKGCGRVYSLEKDKCNFCHRRKLRKVWICAGNSGCGIPFTSPYNLKRHLRANTCQNVKTRNLNLLEATGSQSDDVTNPIVPDLGVEETTQNCQSKAVKRPKRKYRKPKKLEDGGCGKLFSKRSSLMNNKKHHSSAFRRRLRWICLFRDGGCGNTFSSKFTLQRHQKNICSKKMKKEVEFKKEVSCQNGNAAEPEDNFNVEMECSVENVEISKIEVMDMDNQDESEVTECENVQELRSDLTIATAIL